MEKGHHWTRGELIIAFYQYCITPFGRIHNRNHEIITSAEKLGRSANALAMKMCNFASFDPIHQKRNVKGLTNVAKADRQIWDEFYDDWDNLIIAFQHEAEKLNIMEADIKELDDEEFLSKSQDQTEKVREIKVRITQSFFRRSVLANYDYRCAICKLNHIKLLIAGHIIPWSINEQRRADPKNGLSLCALHDRAFDKGLLTLDDEYRIVLSGELKRLDSISGIHTIAFLDIEGHVITLPDKFAPSIDALEYHRNHIFIG